MKLVDWKETLLWRVIDRALKRLDALFPPKAVFNYKVGPVRLKPSIRRPTMPLDVIINNEQEIDITLNPGTQGGHPVQVQNPVWTVIQGDATVTPIGDGMSATLRSSDLPGDTQFLVEADADMGEGVEPISDIVRLSVGGAHAATLGLAPGTARQKT